MPASIPRLLLLALGTWTLAQAAQVEVHLTNGSVITGELISESDESVTVKTTSIGKNGPMSATLPYLRSQITEVIRLPDPEEAYQAKSKAASSADDHAALAAWCQKQAFAERALTHAKKAVTLDSKHAAARKLLGELGWVEVDGAWVVEADWLAKQGKVRYQGQVMTIAEAEAKKAEAKQGQALRTAEQQVANLTSTLAGIDRQIADLDKKPVQNAADQAKAKAALAEAEGAKQRYADAKKALADAEDKAAKERQANQNANNGNTGISVATQNAIEDAQRTVNKTKAAAATADSEAAQLRTRIAALENESKSIDKRKVEATARRDQVAKDLDAAKAKVDELKKAPPAPAAGATAPAKP